MKEIVTYRYGSFNDYKGQEHKIIVCALSQRVNYGNPLNVSTIELFTKSDWDGVDATKILTFGVAICNPIDAYDQEHGEMIAYNRAKKYSECPVLTSNRSGFFNTTTVSALIDNYIDYISKDPGSIIPGYDKAKRKFFEEQDLKDDVNKMTDKAKNDMKVLSTATPEIVEYAKKVVKFIQ